jgi:ubiquinone/menaquinone biosynthesis C-methylase UbiE
VIDYDHLAAEYARHRTVHPEVLKSLASTGTVGRGARVLDVGCGTGNYIIPLELLTGCAGWGIDPSEQMLARARERSGTVTFLPGKAERLEFPDDFFDLVFSVDVIHHMGDRPAYFAEAFRVLETRGRVCTVTDSERIIRCRRPMAVYFPETIDVELHRYPRMTDLREEMGRAGFAGISQETVEFAFQLTDAGAYRDKAFSSLHVIPQEAFERGLARMEQDLRAGPVPCLSRYVLLWGTKTAG